MVKGEVLSIVVGERVESDQSTGWIDGEKRWWSHVWGCALTIFPNRISARSRRRLGLNVSFFKLQTLYFLGTPYPAYDPHHVVLGHQAIRSNPQGGATSDRIHPRDFDRTQRAPVCHESGSY